MPVTTSREKKQEERRGRVIEAAMVLAAEGGYEAVHMRDVSAKADVAMGTIYRYFSSKDELLAVGLVSWIQLIRTRLAERTFPGDSPAERLANTLEFVTRYSDRASPLMKALITAMWSSDPAVTPHKLEVEQLMADIIRGGMGDVPEHVDVAGVQRVIRHVWTSAINRWVGGMAPTGSVAEELRHAAYLLLPGPAAPTGE
jgi:AcrR family transcriptional regulator